VGSRRMFAAAGCAAAREPGRSQGPKMVGPASVLPSMVRKRLSPPTSELRRPITSLLWPPLIELSGRPRR